jgi:hypothetical protein
VTSLRAEAKPGFWSLATGKINQSKEISSGIPKPLTPTTSAIVSRAIGGPYLSLGR